VRTEKTQPR